MSIRLRPACADDLDAIMAIETDVFGADAWSADGMRAELAGRHRHYLVAEDDAAPEAGLLGYAGLFAAHGSGEADIQTIAVVSSARGRGLGRRLMAALLDEAVRRGARDVFLEVRADNPVAQRLYRSLGFARIGSRARYYQPDGVDAIVMRLRPAVAPASATLAEAPAAATGPAADRARA